ncbi:MAG: transcription termination factor NusA [Phycisphaerae bacterium]|nr:transcription termination factor NusA [Phycisphaerae bacterium]
MSSELLRIVDAISRDKNIDKEGVLADLETAMVSAIRKAYGAERDATVTIDRLSGAIAATMDGAPIAMAELGRIAAQTAKQVMIQRIREAERGSIFEEFSDRKGTIVTGTVARFEGGALVVNIGRTEGFLPKSQQIPGETHQPGERVRALILEVREAPHQVKIVLSRAHPDFIRRLFELEVPEVAERIIEIKALAREAGYRTKVAVTSIDSKVDAVGACVGVRGSRIKNIVEELGGEKIDIVRWNESSQILISNALKPAEIQDIALCFELGRATVVVPEDQLSLAIGKRGQNVRLAARLTGWDIDILTPREYNRGLDRLATTLRTVEGVDDVIAEKITLLGMISVMDVEEVGAETLVEELKVAPELAERIVNICAEEAKKVQAELEAEQAAAEAAKLAAAQAPPIDEAAVDAFRSASAKDEEAVGAPATPGSESGEPTTAAQNAEVAAGSSEHSAEGAAPIETT